MSVLARASTLLVKGDSSIPTTIFSGIATALHHTVTHNTWNRSAFCRYGITAVTLGRILEASNREAFARAVVNAGLNGHLIGTLSVTGQDAAVDVISTATNILPFLRNGQVGEVRLRRTNRVRSAAIILRDRCTWACLHRVATWEGV